VMIENRGRVLANRTSADGTRYFELKAIDLAGLTEAQILQRLNPAPVTATQGVRKFESVVDLPTPVVIYTSDKQPVNIGTVTVQGPVKNLEVHANIVSSDLTIVRRK